MQAHRDSAQLQHPSQDSTVCVFTDASDVGWAAVATQVREFNLAKSIDQQAYEMIAYIDGVCKGAQCQWSVNDKERCPIVRASIQLECSLSRQRGSGCSVITPN